MRRVRGGGIRFLNFPLHEDALRKALGIDRGDCRAGQGDNLFALVSSRDQLLFELAVILGAAGDFDADIANQTRGIRLRNTKAKVRDVTVR